MTKIWADINNIKTNKINQKSNETRSSFFEETYNWWTFKRIIKKKGESTQINKIRNEIGKIIMDTTEIQRIIRKFYEQLYANKLDNLGEMDKFLETYNLSKLNQEELQNLNRPITSNKNQSCNWKKPPNKQKS